jgi:hypothetical protein
MQVVPQGNAFQRYATSMSALPSPADTNDWHDESDGSGDSHDGGEGDEEEDKQKKTPRKGLGRA